MTPNYELNCLVKRLDCSVLVKIKVTGKVENSSDCSSQRYLLNRWTFCNQTWYGDAPPWTRVLCKKIDLLFSSSGSQWGLIWSNIWLFLIYIYRTADLFTPKFSWMVHHYKLERCILLLLLLLLCMCLKIRLLFSRSRPQGRSKTLLNLYVFYIFCITYLLATKLAELIYYCL